MGTLLEQALPLNSIVLLVYELVCALYALRFDCSFLVCVEGLPVSESKTGSSEGGDGWVTQLVRCCQEELPQRC